MAKLFVCSAAERDYTEALCWYSERSARAADEFDEEFHRALQAIASDPDRFPACDARHRFYLMRRFPFQIIFRKVADEIDVIAVAHTSRSSTYWSDR
jgi:plasmid stabilization system protein ParE